MSKRNVKRVRLDDPEDDRGEDERVDNVSKRTNGSARTGDRNDRTTIMRSDGRPQTFLRGNMGRPPGTPNALPAKISRAIEESLDNYPGGPAAYMRWLMVAEPATYGALLKRKLPQVVQADLDPNSLMAKLLQASAAARAARNGNVIDLVPTRRSFLDEDR